MTNAKTVWMMAVVLSLAGLPALARIDFNDSRTHDINYEINDDVWVDYQAPGMQTIVNLLDGGSISLSLFPCEDSRINILGGSIEYDVWISDSSQVKISGGSIGYHTWAFDSSHVDIFDGSMKRLHACDNSRVNFSGGSVRRWLSTYDSGRVNISGGSIRDFLLAHGNSRINICGGFIGDGLVASSNSIITIHGSDFAVDGQPFGYGILTSINGRDWRPDEPRRHLTGMLASGEPIDNDFYIGYDAKIVLVPKPAIEADVDIDPDTLNLASEGRWIICYIWPPEDYDVADIDPDTIFLEDKIKAESVQVNEQQQVVIARFRREQVQDILSIGQVELKVTGLLTDEIAFHATDIIRVIDKVGGKSAK